MEKVTVRIMFFKSRINTEKQKLKQQDQQWRGRRVIALLQVQQLIHKEQSSSSSIMVEQQIQSTYYLIVIITYRSVLLCVKVV